MTDIFKQKRNHSIKIIKIPEKFSTQGINIIFIYKHPIQSQDKN